MTFCGNYAGVTKVSILDSGAPKSYGRSPYKRRRHRRRKGDVVMETETGAVCPTN